MTEKPAEKPAETHWLVRPETIRKLWIGGCLLLALTVAAQFLVHMHEYFGIDGWFGFNAVYGFATCVAMVVFAKGLGYLIKRPDGYYEAEEHIPLPGGPAVSSSPAVESKPARKRESRS